MNAIPPDPTNPEHVALARAHPLGWAWMCSGGRYQRLPHIKHLHARAADAISRGGRLLVEMPPRHGKALAVDTPIPTPSGWTTMGEIQAGDYVYGPDGSPCLVTGTSDVHLKPTYEVVFSGGETIVASGDHLWTWLNKDRALKASEAWWEKATTGTTLELADQVGTNGGRRVPNAMPLQADDVDLPIDPYILGVWLGDGTTRQAAITSMDDDIIRRVEDAGYPVCNVRGGAGRARVYYFKGLHHDLRVTGLLGNKHIPEVYMRASVRQRMDLLAGLMDTDGCHAKAARNHGRVSFCNKLKPLAEGVAELFHSLGCRVNVYEFRMKLNGVDKGPCWKVECSPTFDPFYCSRKRGWWRPGKVATRSQRIVRSITPTRRNEPVKCIKVDSPGELFLAGRAMIPTHNTEALRYIFGWYMGMHPGRHVIYACHTKTLTERLGAYIRADIDAFGPQVFGQTLSKSTRAKGDWALSGEGEFYGVGVGGSPHGRGAGLLGTDDIVPNAEASRSEVQMGGIEDFILHDLLSRRQDDHFVHLGIQTRWGPDDPHGLLASRLPGVYETLRFPAIATGPDDLGRQEGDALWPDKFPIHVLEEQRLGMHPHRWAALYQQDPVAASGGIWQRRWWDDQTYTLSEDRMYVVMRDGTRWRLDELRRFVVVDLAISEKKQADYTVIGAFALTTDRPNRLIMLDMRRERMEGPDINPAVRSMLSRWGATVAYYEKAGQQTMAAQYARREEVPALLIGRDKDCDVQIAGDKVAVAYEATPFAAAGRLIVPLSAGWLADWESEMLSFPGSAHDDLADVTAWACHIAMKAGRGSLFLDAARHGARRPDPVTPDSAPTPQPWRSQPGVLGLPHVGPRTGKVLPW